MLWHERLKRHCQPVKIDMPYQATIRQRHLEWIGKKVQIQPLHKLAIFLWPKFNQLRMFCETERDAILQDAKSWVASYRATGGNMTEEPVREVTSDMNWSGRMPPRLMKTLLWMRSKYTSTLPPARSMMIEICWVGGVNMRRPFLCCQDLPVMC